MESPFSTDLQALAKLDARLTALEEVVCALLRRLRGEPQAAPLVAAAFSELQPVFDLIRFPGLSPEYSNLLADEFRDALAELAKRSGAPPGP